MKHFALLVAAVLVTFSFAANGPAHAGAVSAPGLIGLGVAANADGLVQRTHGWHCSIQRGYVPRLGYRALHRHPRACRRAGSRHFRCINKYGHGWRYRRCLRRGY